MAFGFVSFLFYVLFYNDKAYFKRGTAGLTGKAERLAGVETFVIF
jgi:hypothetical protein